MKKKENIFISKEAWNDMFAKRLVAIMEAMDINQSELAELTGISQGEISNYIHGKITPTAYNIYKLCNALLVKPEFFIEP